MQPASPAFADECRFHQVISPASSSSESVNASNMGRIASTRIGSKAA